MNIQEEKVNEYLKEMVPLMIEHRKEINLFDKPLDPDFDSYLALEQAGFLKSYTLRDDGELVGYVLYHVYNHLHHREVKVAQMDLIYVKPSHRLSGLKLLRYTEEALTKEGVSFILTGAPEISRLGGVLEKKGYKVFEKMYIKEI